MLILDRSVTSIGGTFASNQFDMEQGTMKFSKGSWKTGSRKEARQQMTDIRVLHKNDVLLGRGGKNNQHLGNETFRNFARERIEDYRNATKKGKSDLSRELVQLMRELDPPTRFLRKDPDTEKWFDVGDDIAREKASQVLRDSVAERNGPLANAHESDGSPSRHSASPGEVRVSTGYPRVQVEESVYHHVKVEDTGDPRLKVQETGYPRVKVEEAQINITDPISSDTTAVASKTVPSMTAAFHLHNEGDVTHFDTSVPYAPVPYPNVTPASEQSTRKRRRQTPFSLALNSGDYFSPYEPFHPHQNSQNMVMRSPLDSSLPFYSHSAFSNPYSPPSAASRRRTPASDPIPEHYASSTSRSNQPWMADVNPHPRQASSVACERLQVHVHGFDPYNEDILSDHSDHGDRSISPIMYPKRDSL